MNTPPEVSGQFADYNNLTKYSSKTKNLPANVKAQVAHFDTVLKNGSSLSTDPLFSSYEDNDTPVALRDMNGQTYSPMDTYSSENRSPDKQEDSGKWRPPDGPHVVGREGTFVEPGGPIGTFIEYRVASGYTFGEKHDALVDTLTRWGVPDFIANVPTMIPAYLYGIVSDNNELHPEERPDKFELLNIRF